MLISGNALIYFILLSLLAEVLGTIGGFGSSLFFVPIAGYFLDFHSVLGITALYHVCSNLAKISMFRNGFDKRLLMTVGIPSVLFVIAGAVCTQYFSADKLQLFMALFLIVLSLALLVFRNRSLKPTLLNSMSGGALSGFAAGLLGSGGAIRALTLAAFNIEKNVFIATSALIDLCVDLSRSVVYVSKGYVPKTDWYLILILLVISIAGTYLGKVLLSHFTQAMFKWMVLLLIFATGVMSLIKLAV